MKFLLTSMFVWISQYGFAATSPDFLIKANLSYSRTNQKIESSHQYVLSGAGPKQGWTTLIPAKDGVTLVGRLRSADTKSLGVEALIVDTSKESSAGCYFEFKAELNKEKKISCEGASISFSAAPMKN